MIECKKDAKFCMRDGHEIGKAKKPQTSEVRSNELLSGAELITQERQRQVSEEGYNAEHDDKHVSGEFPVAAACYAVEGIIFGAEYYAVQKLFTGQYEGLCEDAFPWVGEHDKRKKHDPVKRLVIAGALIAAEIDRLQRKGNR